MEKKIPTAAVATMYGYFLMLVNLQCNQGMHSIVLLLNEKKEFVSMWRWVESVSGCNTIVMRIGGH